MFRNILILFILAAAGPVARANVPDLGRSLTAAFRQALRTDRDDPRHPAFADTVSALVVVNRWAHGEACRFDPELCGERARALIERTFTESLRALGPLDEVARLRVGRFAEALSTEVNGQDFARRAFALTNARKIRERCDLSRDACLHVLALSLTVDIPVGISAIVCKCFSPQLVLSLLIGNAVVAYLTWAAKSDERAALRLDEVPNLIGPPVAACGVYLRANPAPPPLPVARPSLPLLLGDGLGLN